MLKRTFLIIILLIFQILLNACVEEEKQQASDIIETPINADSKHPIFWFGRPFINLISNHEYELGVWYYNKMETTAEQATIIIDDCKSNATKEVISSTTTGEYPVFVTSSTQDAPSSEVTYFDTIINDNNLDPTMTYSCTLKVVKETDPSIEYESKKFILDINKS